jgi:hypothetical protein
MKPKGRGTLVTLLLLWGAAACAGPSDGGKAAGGAGNVAGTGGNTSSVAGAGGRTSNAAGAGGGAQLITQAALTATVGSPAVPVDQMTCPAIQTYQLGTPAPTTNDPGRSVISGDAGSLINCAVTGNGPFSFSGSIKATTTTGEAIDIVFANGVVGADFTGTADISFYAPELTNDFRSTAPCAITVEDEQVKGGAIWASFHCPQIASPPSGLCGLSGTVVLENCAGS